MKIRSFLASMVIALIACACSLMSPAPKFAHEHAGVGHIVLGPEHRPHVLGLIQYTTTHRSAAMTDLNTALGSTGFLMILTGSQPATVATVDSGTELVDLPMSATPGSVTSGVLTLNAITSTAAVATGTAAHFLFCTTSSVANCVAVSSTTRIAQGSVGTSGSDLNFSGGVSFTTGETISISSFTITATGA